MPDVPTGFIPNVRGSQVGSVNFQCLADPTHSALSSISFLSFSSSDDLYEILCRLRGKSLVFSCAPCSKKFRSGWQDVVQVVLRNGLEKIMDGLRNHPTICHLLMCAQVRFSAICTYNMSPLRNTLNDLLIHLSVVSLNEMCFMCVSEQCEACPDFEVVKERSGCCLHLVEKKLENDLYTTLVRSFIYVKELSKFLYP